MTTPYLYGGTVDSFKKIYPKFGIAIDQVAEPDDINAYRQAIKPDTKAIYVESISNPNAVVADLEALAKIAHEHDIPLIVDNTVATPYLLNPIKYGADIVVYSATKALSGHGNVIAGVIVEAGKFNWANGKFPHFLEPYHTLRTKEGQPRNFLEVFPDFPFSFRIRLNYLAYFGAALSPFDAYLVLLGLETLSERVNKQVASTEAVIRYLEKHRGVAWVNHPRAEHSPCRTLAEKYLPKGAGSLLTFGFNGSEQQSAKFIDALKLFSYQANIGDARSLVINSPKTTHGELTPAKQAAADISSDTIRLSIGLEDPDDLIADLEQAFVKALA
ncbi:O-acetyl-L-homoserine sulfhydrylase [Sporomusa silvacetica DSM 10669]|uniref:O-acetyl-L-homoserine sulfhydrylase n=1 Tax=Sporomusa silvacetica DSM 10669 TaxID=1123289 RepID=A0ABZ3IHA8_9FIRM|nr:methionine gamma-lyase [Sporomusa silvacetica DSM 10669]